MTKLDLSDYLKSYDNFVAKTNIKLADRIFIEVSYVEGAYSDSEYENLFKGCEKEKFETIEEAYKAFLERIGSFGLNESHIRPFPTTPEINKEYLICNRYLSIKLLFKEVS